MADPKKPSQLLETTSPASGDLFMVIKDGTLQKMTIDTLFRLHNDDYFLSCGVDPIATDVDGNTYGRYHFTTCDTMISGNSRAYFRTWDTTCIISETGTRTLLGITNYNDGSIGSKLVLENRQSGDGVYASIIGKGINDHARSAIQFVSSDVSEESGEIALSIRGSGDAATIELMRLSDDDRVGIGNIAPSGKLHVRTTTSTDQKVFVGSSSNASFDPTFELHGPNFTNDGFGIKYDAGTKHTYLYGIGDSNASYMHFIVNGEPSAYGGAGNEIMTFEPKSNVGINVTNPSYSLQVSGHLSITGDVTTQRGLILTAPAGASFLVTVDNAGTLSTTAI